MEYISTYGAAVGGQADANRPVRRCVAMEQHWRLVRKDPDYRSRRLQIERDTQEWLRRYGGEGARTGLIRIPVVVHVIHNTPEQNISDAKIFSQIDVLNEDFRRLNPDAGSTPPAFAGVAADARIEFALAARDPSCAATTGITRTSTTVSGWTYPGDGMKSAAGGGHDPWDVDKYLNMWVVNYTDATLGYGTFPGMPANIQGVVIDYRAFGTVAPVDPNFNLGRTATHEVGHWLNLLHIWGDDGTACTGTDSVADTPNQAGYNTGVPTFPHVSCMNGPNADMFMNYMDYSDDAAYNMFTVGQSERMDAALHTARTSILASDGLVPPSGGVDPDLWSKDVSDDLGAEPDPSSQAMWISDDIWVRRSNDGIANEDHQNPEYRPPGSASNYVYVRVRNRGCGGTQSGTVRLYWAKASSGLSWPAPWDGSVTSPAVMGGVIGSHPVTVAGGDDEILIFPWMPPNPADYASFGADQSHFCLLSRIETSTTPPYGMTFPETANLHDNVQKNNNIVWKNIAVVEEEPGGGRFASVLVANFEDEVQRAHLVFKTPKGEPSVLDWGTVVVRLSKPLAEWWEQCGAEAAGFDAVNGATLKLLKAGARIGPIELAPGEIASLHVEFVPARRPSLGVRVLALDVEQRVGQRIVGGQRFVLKTQPDPRGVAPESSSTVFDGVTWVSTGAHPCGGCGC